MESGPPPGVRYDMSARLFAAMALSASLTPLNSTMIAVALPDIGAAFNAGPAALTQWLVTIYLVVALVCQSPSGKFSDMWGRRRALNVGRLIFCLGALIGMLAPTLGWMVAARILMAAGGSLMVPTAMAVLRNNVPPERRARTFGFVTAVMAGSAAVGPAVGGVLIDAFGWHSVFLVNVPLALLALALQWGCALEEDEGTKRHPARRAGEWRRFDWQGSLLLGGALSVAVVALQNSTGLTSLALGAVAVASFGAFVTWERVHAQPVLDLKLFTRARFVAGSGSIALQNLALYAILFQIPFLVGKISDVSASIAGAVMIAMPASSVVLAPVGGLLAERIGAKLTVCVGELIVIIGIALLAGAGPVDSLYHIALWLVLVGGGLGLCMGPAQAGALGAVHRHESGMAAAAISTMRYFGGVLGIAGLAIVLNGLAPDADIDVYRAQLAVFIGPLALAMGLAFLLPRKGEHGFH